MDAILARSAEPDDRPDPLLGFDETRYPLVSDVRHALPAGPGQPRRDRRLGKMPPGGQGHSRVALYHGNSATHPQTSQPLMIRVADP
jgi:hypothetical protein